MTTQLSRKANIDEPPIYNGKAALSSSIIKLQGYYQDIIDDSEVNRVSSNYDWVLSNNYGYNGTEYHYFFPSSDGPVAWWQWLYNDLSADTYDIFLTWVSNPNRPTSVRYDIITPNNQTLTYYINQRLSPVGSIYGGVSFQKLCSISAIDNIAIRVYGDENYYVIADATMIVHGNKLIFPKYNGNVLVNIPINHSSDGLFKPPIYSGILNVDVQKISISYGVNIFKGIVYKGVLYVTDKIVKTNYITDLKKDSRFI